MKINIEGGRLKEISNVLINLHKKIGLRNLIVYVFLGLLVFGVVNFRTVTKTIVEMVSDIQEDIHTEKMEKRDELMKELKPILQEFRASTNADRILYFEYHNSKENLVGIPFKYADLITQETAYGIPSRTDNRFRDINSGSITDLYEGMKCGKIVYCNGERDTIFRSTYPGVFDLFKGDDGVCGKTVFISIPGIDQPIGFIVLEWDYSDEEIDINEIRKTSIKNGSYISRINALIMSKSN